MGLWKGLSEDGQTITIRRFSGKFKTSEHVTSLWISEHASEITTGAVLDVETTGLDRKNGRVIEIAIRTFKFHKPTGVLVSVDSSYSGLQDPGFPLSPEITEITGLTDQELKGKSIDWTTVQTLLSSVEIIIAHNAGFDRPFVEKELNQKIPKVWACSWSQIDWDKKGYGVHKLELLTAFHGFFTDSHRALNDVDALLHLLSFKDEQTGHGYLSELYVNANRTQVRIIASGSPFEAKDLLKSNGYRWDSEIRSWNKVEYTDLVPTEIQWLESVIYRGRFIGKMVEIPVLDRFRAE